MSGKTNNFRLTRILDTTEILDTLFNRCQNEKLLLMVQMKLCFKLNKALDENQVNGVQNENCSQYISPNSDQTRDFEFGEDDDRSHLCPPWYTNKNESCKKGKIFTNAVLFQMRTQQTWLQTFYCMTTSNENTKQRKDVIGGCLFSFDNRVQSSFYPLPCNISKLNDYTCAGLNRKGQLCGRCVEGYGPPVFSYSLSCVNCTDYHLVYKAMCHVREMIENGIDCVKIHTYVHV